MKINADSLDIELCDTPQDAPIYRAPEYKAANLQTAVVVGMGTMSGNPTVDFIFEDDTGQRYIAMLTGSLIDNLAGAIRGMKERTDAQKK